MSLFTTVKNEALSKMYEKLYTVEKQRWHELFTNFTPLPLNSGKVMRFRRYKPVRSYLKMFFRTKAFKHLKEEINSLRGELYDLRRNNEDYRHRVKNLETEVELFRATTDRREYYLQSLECNMFGPMARSNEDLEKEGFKCVNILESPRARIWVKG